MRWLGLAGLIACLLAVPAWAESGVMIKDEDMRSGASGTASAVAPLAKGTQVELLGRQGGWRQVRYGGKTGWVRLLSVRSGVAGRTDVGAEVGGLLGVATTRRDPGRVVATAGVRGLSEEELRGARFDAQELQRMDRYAVSRPDAQRYAAEAGLARRDVAYLPSPQATSGSGTASPWGGDGL